MQLFTHAARSALWEGRPGDASWERLSMAAWESECSPPAADCEQVFKSLWQGELQQQTTKSSSILLLQFQWFNKDEDKASEISLVEGCQTYLHSKPAVGNSPLASLSCTIKQHKRGWQQISSISVECIYCCCHNETIKKGNLGQCLNGIGVLVNIAKLNLSVNFFPEAILQTWFTRNRKISEWSNVSAKRSDSLEGKQVSSGFVTWPISSWQCTNPSIGTIGSCQIEDWTNVRLGHRCFHAADVCHFVSVSAFRQQREGTRLSCWRVLFAMLEELAVWSGHVNEAYFFLMPTFCMKFLKIIILKEICLCDWYVFPFSVKSPQKNKMFENFNLDIGLQ